MMRQYLNDIHKKIYDRHYSTALKGVADVQQAHSIARERTLLAVMRASAAITAIRENPPHPSRQLIEQYE